MEFDFYVIGSTRSKSHLSFQMEAVCGSHTMTFSEGAGYTYKDGEIWEKYRGVKINSLKPVELIINCKKCLKKFEKMTND